MTWIPTRLVIVPGPEGAQRPYLTNLAPDQWKGPALRELYRLRWQIELVFKELKQNLNLETLPSADRHAVQIFVWASLIALALSRCVAAWIQPLAALTGLAAQLRPHLVTRALRATIRMLARALTAAPREALVHLQVLAEEVTREANSRDTEREDSFGRLLPLLPARAA
jgi:hypothetical protein